MEGSRDAQDAKDETQFFLACRESKFVFQYPTHNEIKWATN
jgi:hypothetical protein